MTRAGGFTERWEASLLAEQALLAAAGGVLQPRGRLRHFGAFSETAPASGCLAETRFPPA